MLHLISSMHISTHTTLKTFSIVVIISVPDSLPLHLSSNLVTENKIAKCCGHHDLPNRYEHHEVCGRH